MQIDKIILKIGKFRIEYPFASNGSFDFIMDDIKKYIKENKTSKKAKIIIKRY